MQTIGYATSSDLMTWTKNPSNPMLGADSRWYETLESASWSDGAFRDPWVFPDPAGDGWHMLITARSNTGAVDDRGVIGHATSPDLREWILHPPLSESGQGFAQLEVMQVELIDGRPTLLFSCLPTELSAARRPGVDSGTWVTTGETLRGPWDLAGAVPLTSSALYSARTIRDRAGVWQVMAFEQDESQPTFGRLIDPRPLAGLLASAATLADLNDG